MFLEFPKERYYKTLIGFFLAVLIYELIQLLNLPFVPTLNIIAVLSVLVIYILAYQSLRASRISRTINFVLMFLFIIAYVFKLMHWPYGEEAILFTYFSVLVSLIVDHIILIRGKEKQIELLILALPAVHFVNTIAAGAPRSLKSLLELTEGFVILALCIFLSVILLRKKKKRRQYE